MAENIIQTFGFLN